MPPVNDNMADAIVLPGRNGSMAVSNVGATTEDGDPWEGSSVWFRWTAPATYQAVFALEDADFDYYLAVLTGTPGDLEYGAYTSFEYSPLLYWPVVAGETYYLAVTSYAGTGTGTLHWSRRVGHFSDWVTPEPVLYPGVERSWAMTSHTFVGSLPWRTPEGVGPGGLAAEFQELFDALIAADGARSSVGVVGYSQQGYFFSTLLLARQGALPDPGTHSATMDGDASFGISITDFGMVDMGAGFGPDLYESFGWQYQYKLSPADFPELSALVLGTDFEAIPDTYVDRAAYVDPNGNPNQDGSLTATVPEDWFDVGLLEYEELPRLANELLDGGKVGFRNMTQQRSTTPGVDPQGEREFVIERVEPPPPFLTIGDRTGEVWDPTARGPAVEAFTTDDSPDAEDGFYVGSDAITAAGMTLAPDVFGVMVGEKEYPVREVMVDETIAFKLTYAGLFEPAPPDPLPPYPEDAHRTLVASTFGIALVAAYVPIQFPRFRYWIGDGWETNATVTGWYVGGAMNAT